MSFDPMGRATLSLLACVICAAAPASAQSVTVSNAWVRGTVPAQTATGAFMDIVSKDGAKLVGATTPVAASVEMHEMRMDGNVMQMREMKSVDLPAGKAIKFDPRGYHLMLLGLKQPVKPGTTTPLTLTVESRDGKRSTVNVEARVRALGAQQ